MIFAKTDVDLPDHPRACKLGDDYFAALGLWHVALCYCRKHRTDGLIQAEAPFLQRKGAARLAQRLVDVGLWSKLNDGVGFELLRYADKNDTKAQIDSKMQADRERKRDRIPDGFRSESKRTHDREGVGIPPSGSHSGFVSSERVRGEPSETPAWTRDPMGAESLGGAWRDGVISGGGRVTAPSRSETARIVAAVEAHAPSFANDNHGARQTWVHNEASKWAMTSPPRVHVFAWVDWLNSGRRDPRAPPKAPEVPPPPPRTFAPAEDICTPEENKRQADKLAALFADVGKGSPS